MNDDTRPTELNGELIQWAQAEAPEAKHKMFFDPNMDVAEIVKVLMAQYKKQFGDD